MSSGVHRAIHTSSFAAFHAPFTKFRRSARRLEQRQMGALATQAAPHVGLLFVAVSFSLWNVLASMVLRHGSDAIVFTF